MNPQREYVLLAFNPDSPPEVRILVARKGTSLEVSLPAGWDATLSAEDREYLSELVSDWRNAKGDSVPVILRELAQLAVGPLRTVESNLLDS
jgi:hypothetical protein